MSVKKAIIIGAGLGGIAAALRLNKSGFKVEVFEKNAYVGGKLTEIKGQGYRFDAGPSLFTMPQYINELFELYQQNPSESFTYTPLNTLCHYFYEDGTRIQVKGQGRQEIADCISKKTSDSSKNIQKHLKHSQYIYKKTNQLFLQSSLHQFKSYLNFYTLKAIFALPFLSIFKSMHQVNANRFKDEKTIQLFNRYATYNGSSPYKAPGILNIIPHLEYNMGAFHPHKGMHSITESLYDLAVKNGIKFHLNTPTLQVKTKKNKVIGIETPKGFHPAEVVVSNVDSWSFYKNLLKDQTEFKKVKSQERSSSALIFYWGINRSFKELDLHNILFSANYESEFKALFESKTIFHDPTVYINISSKLTQSDAPNGCENWFVMINTTANTDIDKKELIKTSKQVIINKINRLLDSQIEKHIEFEEVLSPQDIELKTASYAGSIYGTASNDRMAAFFRHPNFSKTYSNLYFVGGSVHPGGGIPLVLSSAKITAELIKQ